MISGSPGRLMLAGVAFFLACQERPTTTATEQGRAEPIALAGQPLVPDTLFGQITDLRATEDRLYVVDAHNDPGLYVFDRRSGGLLYTWGRSGEGPGEFKVPLILSRLDTADPAVWIFDTALQRITRITEAHLARADRSPPHTVQLSGSRVTALRAGPGGHWIATGPIGEGRFGIFSADGERLGVMGRLPPNPDDIPISLLQQTRQSVFDVWTDGSIVLAGLHAGSLEVFEPDGTLRVSAQVPFAFEPVYETREARGSPQMVLNSDSRSGYWSLALHENGIYALFSGRTIREMSLARFHLANTVHEFEWDGRFRRAWKLDREVSQIAISPDGTQLYAAVVEPVPGIRVYRLDPGNGSR